MSRVCRSWEGVDIENRPRVCSQAQVSYTSSHCIGDAELTGEVAGSFRSNPYSLSFERGNCYFDITNSFNPSGTAQGNDPPNQILANPYPSKKTTSQWFNPAAFAQQTAGTFGNVQRNSLRGPGAFHLDASVSRVFHVEKVGLMFRVDAFNALNHPTWNKPDNVHHQWTVS
jgi:hypothetical protein